MMGATDVTIRGVPMHLYRYEAVSEAIRQAGDFYEAAILDDLRKRFPTQKTIVDVGANIGNHTAYWSAFVPHDRLIAFEPVPANFALLEMNAPLAECHEMALSDAPGFLAMTIDQQNMGRSRVTTGGPLQVEAVTLDSLNLSDVTFVKIDTEGHEGRVLAGALGTVARCHPVILVEEETDFGETLAALDLTGYRRTAAWPGANYLWEWSA